MPLITCVRYALMWSPVSQYSAVGWRIHDSLLKAFLTRQLHGDRLNIILGIVFLLPETPVLSRKLELRENQT